MADVPRVTPTRRLAQTGQEARLAQALRDNLRRRKEQTRAREGRVADAADNAAPSDQRAP